MSVPILPATAACPGCGTLVVLPVEPRPDEPLECGTCGVEVPDHRLAAAHEATELAAETSAAQELPENRIYTRRGLLQGLRDAAADRVMQTARSFSERSPF